MRSSDDVVLAVLNAPVEMRTADIARQVGLSTESTRKIRIGESYVNLFPRVDRITQEQMSRTCESCEFFQRTSKRKSWCNLGYPEACNSRFARGCGAYTPRGAA
jgi:hypothetical protein